MTYNYFKGKKEKITKKTLKLCEIELLDYFYNMGDNTYSSTNVIFNLLISKDYPIINKHQAYRILNHLSKLKKIKKINRHHWILN